jgi:hypothetical protein
LRSELHPKGLEVVTVSLELSGRDASLPYIEAARPEHPSLLDPGHQVDTLLGVVNIPNVVWIDEQGMIVRPAEPGWPDTRQELPATMFSSMPKLGRAPHAPKRAEGGVGQRAAIASGQDRATYADAIRDWVEKGAASEFALTPTEVIERSQPRPMTKSEGAAHFELANHLWRRADATSPSPISTPRTDCSRRTGPTSDRRGPSSATSGSAASSGGSSRAPSRARRMRGRSNRTSDRMCRNWLKAPTTRRPSDRKLVQPFDHGWCLARSCNRSPRRTRSRSAARMRWKTVLLK